MKTGREPRHDPRRRTASSLPNMSGPTAADGPSRPVTPLVVVSVMFVMACLLSVAWLLLHYNHA